MKTFALHLRSARLLRTLALLSLSPPAWAAPQAACESPSFLRDGHCWVIMKPGEACAVTPIVITYEDRPVFCPRDQIISAEARRRPGERPPSTQQPR